MSLRRLFPGSMVPLAGVALAVSAGALAAQGTGRLLFEWSGRVDREVQITMRGRDAWAEGLGRNEGHLSRPAVSSALPQQNGTVRVRTENGRGDAQVVQQPSRQNDYTAIVRVLDRSGGADSYRVSAYWTDSEYGGRDDSDYPWENGRDRGRDNRDRAGRGRSGNDSDGGWGRDRNRGVGQNVLRWSGEVDDGLEIRIQGNRVSYRKLSGKGTRDVRVDVSRGGLPRDNVQLRINEHSGRGDVTIVQQPTARNGYTAVIRIFDPQPRYGFYDFDVTWRNGYAMGR